MTPIPDDVAAAIVAAGHGTNRTAWYWDSRGLIESPAWRVTIGDNYGRGTTARAATLDALALLAAGDDDRERKARAEWKRVRLPYRKAQKLELAEGAAKRASEVRALAATVATMWPEVTP